jgi:hypothetical protein
VNGGGPGYSRGVIPDDTAGRPLTPGEQAAIAALERQLLLDTPAPVRNLAVVRPVRVGRSAGRRSLTPPTAAAPLIALLATACALIGLLGVIGVGVLGGMAVLVSVVATALVWLSLPARFGGPARRLRRPYRTRGRLPRPSC